MAGNGLSLFANDKLGHVHLHDEQAITRGKEARRRVPRASQADLALPDRRDPIAILEEQARTRVPELVPLRYARMLVSPFTFFRGAAAVMAADLAHTPASGLRAQLCGDAHALNFGMFGTPERRLLFDVNDFDETLPGPWEWDVKRLATSLEIAARGNGFSLADRRAIVIAAVHSYHDAMLRFATMRNLDVWYARVDVKAALTELGSLLAHRDLDVAKRAAQKAHGEDSEHALAKLTTIVDGKRRIISAPPLIVPMREIHPADADAVAALANQLFVAYRGSLAPSRRVLFDQFHFVELARKVVGVGSVGMRCWIALFQGIDADDPLFLQIKEAEASVLEPYAGASELPDHAQRVVVGQRVMQAQSDLLLGSAPRLPCLDGVARDFYVRQLRDWKGGFKLEIMLPAHLSLYGRICAWTLARAHARSGDRVAIASYLGAKDHFEHAIAEFAATYADLNERDHAALVDAVRHRRVRAA